jgi:hypothetical protein
VTEVRLVQFSNAALPMLVRLLPIVMLISLEQLLNASSPRLVTLLGIVTLVRLAQSENEESPILVTPSAIVRLFSFEHSENAEFHSLQFAKWMNSGIMDDTPIYPIKESMGVNQSFVQLVISK